MEFNWTKRGVQEWRTLLAEAPRANYLQSLPFAWAMRTQNQKVTKLAVIERNGEACGMMALQEIKVGPIHVIDLYRGPLWFHENPPLSWFAEFAQLLDRTFPRRLFRRRRWLPEWGASSEAHEAVAKTRFAKMPETYETIWLDLRDNEDVLKAKLKPSWRSMLKKAERANVKISVDWTGTTAAAFLGFYDADRKLKKYHGRTSKFLHDEIKAAVTFRDVALMWGHKDKVAIAGIMLLIHGQCATYRIAWTTEEGRKSAAHNMMLWEAIKLLKARGIQSLDLGGIDSVGARGLSEFKRGMGGKETKMLGIYK